MSYGVAAGIPLRWWIHTDGCWDQPGHRNMGPPTGLPLHPPPPPHLLRPPTEIHTFRQTGPLMCFMCLWFMWIWIKERSALSATHSGGRQFTAAVLLEPRNKRSLEKIYVEFLMDDIFNTQCFPLIVFLRVTVSASQCFFFCQISGQISSLALRMSVFELKAPLSHRTRLLVSCFILKASCDQCEISSWILYLLSLFLLAEQNAQNIELIVSLNSNLSDMNSRYQFRVDLIDISLFVMSVT